MVVARPVARPIARPVARLAAREAASTPQSIFGALLIAQWNADRSDLITLSGAAVTSWKDIIAGYDLVQAVSGARPLYSATSFGGAPGVTFDGIDDELTCTTAGLLPLLPNAAEPGEILAVTHQSALAADAAVRILASYGAATSPTRRGVERTVVTGVVRFRITTGTGAGSSTKTATVGDFSSRHVVRGRWGAADHAVAIDGLAEESGAIVPDTSVLRLRLGANSNTAAANFWAGSCRDLLLVAGIPSVAQMAAFNAWALPRRML
jgi:hypothetical protein